MAKALKFVLITGANRGLGLGFVKQYLQDGWYVLACVRDIERSKNLKILMETNKANLQLEVLDISNEKSIGQFIKRIKNTNFKFDVVINNAGICLNEDFGNYTSKTFETTFNVNTIGVALFSQAIQLFIKAGGKLINISSGMGSTELNINPTAGLDAYAMSKAALNIFTKRLASKIQFKNITVVALSPGWVKTDMGGEEAPLNVEDAIFKLVDTIIKLTILDSGKFLSEEVE